MSISTDINIQKEVSCRVTNSVLKYLQSEGYNYDSIVRNIPYSKEYLSDPHNWVTYETRETLCRRAAELVNDDAIMFKVGLSTIKLHPLGGIESMVRLLTGPKIVYKRLPMYASLFDRVFKFKTKSVGKNKVIVKMGMEGNNYLPSKDSCYYAQGILAAIPTVWSLPAAEIRETKCMCKPELDKIKDDVQYEADICEFEVQWQPLISWHQRLRDNLLGWISPQTKDVKGLEESYRQVDQKNSELVARNRQLAAVREIALGLDRVRTIDEALSLAVEQAREIDGILFVLVQKLDESKKFVITPYYSRIRNQFRYMVNTIKALGFDPDKELGESPTSKKFRLPLSKLKIGQDMLKNPRVMVFPSLKEMLADVWPRILCDSIQKIMGIKKFVLVPLMVEGEYWGSILYFLTHEVPTDILEMIGAHCAIAIKNIGYTNALASEALRRRILIDKSRDGIVVIDQHGKVYESNQRFAEMLGYTTEEMKQLHIFDWEFLYPKARVVEMMRTVDEKGDHFETQHRRKDGTIYDVEISTNAAVIAGQKLIFCVCRDITERKKTEEKIQKSEEKYRMIFESANDILLLLDKKGKIIDVNRKITDIGGYDRTQLLGKNFRVLTKMMPRKSIAIVAKNFVLRLLGVDVPPYEVEMFRSNGELVNIEINAIPVKDDNKIIGTLATLRDVTERKKSESALKYQRELIEQIIATIPNAVLVINQDKKVLLANNTFYKNFYLKKDDVENKRMSEVIRIKELDQALANLIKTKKKNLSLEFRLQLYNTQRIFTAGIVKMQNQRYLLFMNDITEEREQQERLYLTDRLASVGEMASGVAHELNNPLTSIIGLSSLLTKRDMSDDIKEDLSDINSEAQRCAAIVKNLLAFARKHTTMKQPLNVIGIVEDVLKLRAYEHKANNITVETIFPNNLPEVLVDYFQMQQVFLNIILNAETAMIDAHGHGTLKITCESANNYIRISFSDDGPGISKENIGQIFNPFFTTKEVGKGTGLGLSICYGIVTAHGGKIYANSEYGHGVTFIVELPINKHQVI